MRFLWCLISLILVSACVSTPIGPTGIISPWNCGLATAETKYGECLFKDDQSIDLSFYSQIFEPPSGFNAYKGPLIPINYNEAAPHGWGKVMFNSKVTEVKFNYGTAVEAKLFYDDKSSFIGTVFPNMAYKQGAYENQDFVFVGSFADKNMTKNPPKKGSVTYKKTGNKFEGFIASRKASWHPSEGTYYSKLKNCEYSFRGRFIYDEKEDFFAPDYTKEFSVRHPDARLTASNGINGPLSIDFIRPTQGDIKISNWTIDSSFLIKSIKSKNKVLNYDSLSKDIRYSEFDWSDFDFCNSSPKYESNEAFLEGVDSRIVIADESIDINRLTDFGFNSFDSLPYDKKNNVEADQIVIFKYIDTQFERNITSSYSERSTYISGQREVYNPKYDSASMRVMNARDALSRARFNDAELDRQPCYNDAWKCALAIALLYEVPDAERELKSAMLQLERTPRTILEDTYSEYEVQKLDIEAKKRSKLKISLIDLKNNEVYEKIIPFSEENNFTVINSPVAESDTNLRRLKSGTSSESAVDSWMNRKFNFDEDSLEIMVSLKTDKYRKKGFGFNSKSYVTQALQNEDQVPMNSMSKKSIKLSKDYEIEDSILVIDTLDGMGTGFYISENLVISNQHVVEEAKFVNLRTFSGEIFTGEVTASNISKDLALLKVPKKGIPLKFEPNCVVKRRENVFTVGHPKGFEYSTSRGIVSSIRNISNPFYKAVGQNIYIQIDASISSGNSGGPLFNTSEEVIGVNTWGRVDGQNLNFAIHCSEVKNFLSKNM